MYYTIITARKPFRLAERRSLSVVSQHELCYANVLTAKSSILLGAAYKLAP